MRRPLLPISTTSVGELVACALTEATGRSRARRWQRLAALGGGRLEASGPDAVIVFERELDAVEAELAALVALERRCCTFLRFDTQRTAQQVRLLVTQPDRAADAPHVTTLVEHFVA